MIPLVFHIIATKDNISLRWEKAFQKEGWEVVIHSPCQDDTGLGCPELDLLEVGNPFYKTGEDLKELLKNRAPVSLIVFAEQHNISNNQISSFLNAGADDFIYKNLDERVLVAKLKAHIRRIMPAITEAAAKLISCGGEIQIDRSRRSVRIAEKPGKQTELVNVTQKEFDILALLVSQERRVISRDTMLEELWGESAENVYSECIDKHVESLRRKLGHFGKKIKTVYGAGYMFTGDSKP